MSIKEIIKKKFADYRASFDAAKDLQEKFDIANLFSEYLVGVKDTMGAFDIAADEAKPVAATTRVVNADIEKIQSEYDLQESLA